MTKFGCVLKINHFASLNFIAHHIYLKDFDLFSEINQIFQIISFSILFNSHMQAPTN